jgi:hypothetical protein
MPIAGWKVNFVPTNGNVFNKPAPQVSRLALLPEPLCAHTELGKPLQVLL